MIYIKRLLAFWFVVFFLNLQFRHSLAISVSKNVSYYRFLQNVIFKKFLWLEIQMETLFLIIYKSQTVRLLLVFWNCTRFLYLQRSFWWSNDNLFWEWISLKQRHQKDVMDIEIWQSSPGLVWFGWVGFYVISTIVGYLIPNLIYKDILNIYDLQIHFDDNILKWSLILFFAHS